MRSRKYIVKYLRSNERFLPVQVGQLWWKDLVQRLPNIYSPLDLLVPQHAFFWREFNEECFILADLIDLAKGFEIYVTNIELLKTFFDIIMHWSKKRTILKS